MESGTCIFVIYTSLCHSKDCGPLISLIIIVQCSGIITITTIDGPCRFTDFIHLNSFTRFTGNLRSLQFHYQYTSFPCSQVLLGSIVSVFSPDSPVSVALYIEAYPRFWRPCLSLWHFFTHQGSTMLSFLHISIW